MAVAEGWTHAHTSCTGPNSVMCCKTKKHSGRVYWLQLRIGLTHEVDGHGCIERNDGTQLQHTDQALSGRQ